MVLGYAATETHTSADLTIQRGDPKTTSTTGMLWDRGALPAEPKVGVFTRALLTWFASDIYRLAELSWRRGQTPAGSLDLYKGVLELLARSLPKLVIQAASTATPPPESEARVWLKQAMLRLAELADLQDDWDTYGGLGPTSDAIQLAGRCIANVLQTFAPEAHGDSAPYDIAPIPNGGVGVEWRRGDKRIEVWIGPDGATGYLMVERRDGQRLAKEGDNVSWPELRHLIRDVLSPTTGGEDWQELRASPTTTNSTAV